jgi:hypothetical protein
VRSALRVGTYAPVAGVLDDRGTVEDEEASCVVDEEDAGGSAADDARLQDRCFGGVIDVVEFGECVHALTVCGWSDNWCPHCGCVPHARGKSPCKLIQKSRSGEIALKRHASRTGGANDVGMRGPVQCECHHAWTRLAAVEWKNAGK